jgi:hypothetical protein
VLLCAGFIDAGVPLCTRYTSRSTSSVATCTQTRNAERVTMRHWEARPCAPAATCTNTTSHDGSATLACVDTTVTTRDASTTHLHAPQTDAVAARVAAVAPPRYRARATEHTANHVHDVRGWRLLHTAERYDGQSDV